MHSFICISPISRLLFIHRLIDWNSEILSRLLKKIIASRGSEVTRQDWNEDDLESYSERDNLEEVREIIPLLSEERMIEEDWLGVEKFDDTDIHSVALHPQVERQLREYVTTIACMYRGNAFHSFEHARYIVTTTLFFWMDGCLP